LVLGEILFVGVSDERKQPEDERSQFRSKLATLRNGMSFQGNPFDLSASMLFDLF